MLSSWLPCLLNLLYIVAPPLNIVRCVASCAFLAQTRAAGESEGKLVLQLEGDIGVTGESEQSHAGRGKSMNCTEPSAQTGYGESCPILGRIPIFHNILFHLSKINSLYYQYKLQDFLRVIKVLINYNLLKD